MTISDNLNKSMNPYPDSKYRVSPYIVAECLEMVTKLPGYKKMSNEGMAKEILGYVNKINVNIVVINVGIYQYFIDITNRQFVDNLKIALSGDAAKAYKIYIENMDGFQQIIDILSDEDKSRNGQVDSE